MQSPSGPGANYGDAHDDEETSRVNNPLPLPSELVQGHSGSHYGGFYNHQAPYALSSASLPYYGVPAHDLNTQAYIHNYHTSGEAQRAAYPTYRSSYDHGNTLQGYGHDMQTPNYQPSVNQQYAPGFQQGYFVQEPYHMERDPADHESAHLQDQMSGAEHDRQDRASSGSLFLPSDEEARERGSEFSQRAISDMAGSPNSAHAQSPIISGPVTRSSMRKRAARNATTSTARSRASRRHQSVSTQLGSPRSLTSSLVERSKPSTGKKQVPENNPDNRRVMDLRTVERLEWPEIVAKMNEEAVNNGKEGGFTEAAVYGRFKRNAHRIARLRGDPNFDYQDWMYMRKKKHGARLEKRRVRGGRSSAAHEPDITSLSAVSEDNHSNNLPEGHTTDDDVVLLNSLYEEASEDVWERVASRLYAISGTPTTADACSKRFKVSIEKLETLSSTPKE